MYKRLNPEAAIGADRLSSPEVTELEETIAELDAVEDRKAIAKYKLDLSRARRADLLLEQSCFYDIYNDWISHASRAYLRDFRTAELQACIDNDNVQALLLLLISAHSSKLKMPVASAIEAEEALNSFKMTGKMTIHEYNRGHKQHLQAFAAAESLIDRDFDLEAYKRKAKVKSRYNDGLSILLLDWHRDHYKGKLDTVAHSIDDLYESNENWMSDKVDEALQATGSPDILVSYATPQKVRGRRGNDHDAAYFTAEGEQSSGGSRRSNSVG